MMGAMELVNSTTREMDNVVQMGEVWGKHALNVNIKLGLPAFKQVTAGLPVDLEILEKLVKFHVKI